MPTPAPLYNITPRATGTVLTADIFNADHQNHVTHTEPFSVNSWEPDVTTMDLETNPFPAGVPSTTNSMSGEIQRIRYVLSEIKASLLGGQFPSKWYTPTADTTGVASFGRTAGRKFQSVAQTIPSGAATIIALDTSVYSQPSTMTVGNTGISAPCDGLYLVGGYAGFGDDDFGPPQDFQLSLRRSTTVTTDPTTIATSEWFSGASTDAPKSLTVMGITPLVAGDLMLLSVYQNSGTDKDLSTAVGIAPSMWMTLIGRVP